MSGIGWRRGLFVAAALTTLAGLGLAVLVSQGRIPGFSGREQGLFIDPDDRSLVLPGARIYAEHCAVCHGATLEGQPDWRQRRADGRLPAPPHDETGHTWHHGDAQLFLMTRDGIAAFAPPGYESDMFGFGDRLGDDEIIAVLAFIKSRWPAEIRAIQERITQRQAEMGR